MTEKPVNTTVDILGKVYSIRCPESELDQLQEAATFLNDKMSAVQESGKAINLERIAIMAALNIAYELLQKSQEKDGVMKKINQRILHLQEKIDHALNYSEQNELVYSAKNEF